MNKLKNIIKENIMLISIIAVGALLRLTLLGAHRFHGDESLYASWAIQMFKGKFMMVSRPYLLYKPPIYLIIAGIFYVIMPINEIFAELPNIIADTISIFMVYKIAMKLWNSGYKAALSGLLFALSPVNILFSATAFLDTMMVMFFLLAFYLLIESKYFIFGVFYGLSIMTKQFAVFYAVFLFFYICWRMALKKDINLLKAFCATLAGFVSGAVLPLLWGIVNSLQAGREWDFALKAWLGITDQHVIYNLNFSDFYKRFKDWMYYFEIVFGNRLLSILVYLSAAVSVVKNMFTSAKNKDAGFAQDAVLIASLLVLVLFVTVSHMPIYNRYIVTFVPLIELVCASSLVNVFKTETKAKGAVLLAVTAIIMLLLPVRCMYQYKIKDIDGYTFGGLYTRNDGIEEVTRHIQNENKMPVNVYFYRDFSWFPDYYLYHNPGNHNWINMSGDENYGKIIKDMKASNRKIYVIFYAFPEQTRKFEQMLKGSKMKMTEDFEVNNRFKQKNIVLYNIVK